MQELLRRSDARGFAQTLGFLGILLSTAGAALYSARHFSGWTTIGLVFLHGTVAAFMINGVHELGHGTVFKTRALNGFFLRVLSFWSWMNFEMFGASHARHHRYTLHPPDDLEVVLPIRVLLRQFLQEGFVNCSGAWKTWRETVRIARGHLRGEWELTLFPPGDPARRRPVIWARWLLAGHVSIVVVSVSLGWWLLPVLTSLTPLYGGWLFFLCNNTQHNGLQDSVSDFRLCCRTFTVNRVVRFLYWQMNYHIEHHMYAAVPCYNLARLHALIKHDLAPCPDGLFATWREIAAIQKRQEADPNYRYMPPIPGRVSALAGRGKNYAIKLDAAHDFPN